MSEKIACLIITYNRCELLRRCIKSVYNQSYRDFDLVIVNNGSTDSTNEFLIEEKKKFEIQNKNRKFEIISIKKNNGPCDAFYEGKKYVFESGYDWAWIMDDDGYADENQLNNLLVGAKETGLYFLNALVLDENNNESLVFSLYEINGKKKHIIKERKDSDKKYIMGSVNTYNGTFINKKIYDVCGNMRKSMIIHCIEIEYERRVKSFGFDCCTVMNAIHYHPVKGNRNIPILKGLINDKVCNFEEYFLKQMEYMVRNEAIVFGLYERQDYSDIKEFLHLFLNFKFVLLTKWLKYYIQGRHIARQIKKNNQIAVR